MVDISSLNAANTNVFGQVNAELASLDNRITALESSAPPPPPPPSSGTSPFVSVKDFGAKGDNVNNDTAEIQAAINYVASLSAGNARGGTLYFPHGNYLINNVLRNPGDVSMVGSSEGSKITAMSSFPANTTQNIYGSNYTFPAPMLWITNEGNPDHARGISELDFDGEDKASVGVMMTRGASWSVNNLRIRDTALDGLVLDGLQNSSFYNIRVARNSRHGINILNSTRYCAFYNPFVRDSGETSVNIGPKDSSYPAFGNSIGPKTQNIQFYGGLLEESKEGFTRQHIIKITDGERHAFYSTAMFRFASVSYVLVQNAPRCRFEHVSLVGSTGAGETAPAFRIESPHTEIISPFFNVWDGSRNLIEVTTSQGLRLVAPRFVGNTNHTGKVLACIPSFDGRFVNYEHDTVAGTTSQRPNLSGYDAVVQYFDTTLTKPIWWRPGLGWRDATGAPV